MSRLRSIPAALVALGLASLALTGCGKVGDSGAGEQPAATGPNGSDIPEGGAPVGAAAQAGPSLASAPAVFGQCASCHALAPGKHGIGPSLFGVYGTRAADIPGYDFSPALKASGLTWDDATLDKWLAGPMQLVPGTRMTYAGLSDPAKRAQMIAYLKTLK